MELNELVDVLKANNAKVYLVGGAVRDFLMNIKPKDFDYCITGLSQESFESLFPTAELQGKDFPVYRMMIKGVFSEVALARTERKVAVGHNGFVIHSSPDVTIEEDLARRDLTINAMAFDLETNELIDPFYGDIDLKNRLLRATTPAFKEDPLRVYRAARFAAKYDFFIEYGTLMMMKELKHELSYLSIERVFDETNKAFMTNTPSLFFRWLKEAEVLDVHFPEIDRLSELEQNPEYHPEGNVFEHTMQVVDMARELANKLPVDSEMVVMYSALLHDVGKYVTKGTHRIKGTPTYILHELAGVPIAEQFLNRFNLKTLKKAILFNVSNHMVFHDAFTAMKPAKAVDFMEGKFEPDGDCHVRDSYIRKPGIYSCMYSIYDYIVVCIADVAGRIRDPRMLTAVFHVVLELIHSFEVGKKFKLDDVIQALTVVTGDHESASKLATDLVIAVKHKSIMEKYNKYAKDVKCSLDIEELKEKYQGEKLGYMIHKDKRGQRVAFMKNARKELTEYMQGIGS